MAMNIITQTKVIGNSLVPVLPETIRLSSPLSPHDFQIEVGHSIFMMKVVKSPTTPQKMQGARLIATSSSVSGPCPSIIPCT